MNYIQLLEHVYRNGQEISCRGELTRECMGVELDVSEAQVYAWPSARPIEHITRYMRNEWAWYLSGDRSPRRIRESASLWGAIQNPDGTVNSNYGYLVFYSAVQHPSLGEVTLSPFQWALWALDDDKNSRQAIVTYNTSGYNFKGNRDYICTQHQAFFIRNNQLDCYVALRSSDLIFGLTYNMPWWRIVQGQLLLCLQAEKYPNLQMGSLKVNIYSAHLYERHWNLVGKLLNQNADRYRVQCKKVVPLGLGFDEYLENLDSYFQLEKL